MKLRNLWAACLSLFLLAAAGDAALAMDGTGFPGRGGGGGGGGYYGAFQTAIIDDSFNFINTLLGYAHGETPGSSAAAATQLGYAPAASRAAMIDNALARANERTTPRTGTWSTWASGIYDSARYRGSADNPGAKSKSISGIAALGYRQDDWLFGLAGSIGRNDLTQDETADTGRINASRLGVFASYRPGPWTFTGALGHGWQEIAAGRLGTSAAFKARTFNAGIEGTRRWPLLGGTLQPLAGAVYTHLDSQGFIESGTTGFEVAANGTSVDSFRGYLGARAYRAFAVGGLVLTPELRVRVLQDFLSMDRGISGSLAADPTITFAVSGLQQARTAERLGGALEVRAGLWWRAAIAYDSELRGGDISHLVSASIRANW